MSIAGMTEPTEYDIVIKKGASFELPFVIQDDNGSPADITSWSFKAQVVDLSGNFLLELYVLPIALTAGSGKLWASASATKSVTATGPVSPSRFVAANYDFFAAPSATTATVDDCYLQGVAKIYPRFTVR